MPRPVASSTSTSSTLVRERSPATSVTSRARTPNASATRGPHRGRGGAVDGPGAHGHPEHLLVAPAAADARPGGSGPHPHGHSHALIVPAGVPAAQTGRAGGGRTLQHEHPHPAAGDPLQVLRVADVDLRPPVARISARSGLVRGPRHHRERDVTVRHGGPRVRLEVQGPGRVCSAWPKFVPTTASVSRKGTAIRGAYRGCPLRRPVVVSPSSGSPASRSTAVVRPPLSRATARSSIGRVWASARAPSGVGRHGPHAAMQQGGVADAVVEVGGESHRTTVATGAAPPAVPRRVPGAGLDPTEALVGWRGEPSRPQRARGADRDRTPPQHARASRACPPTPCCAMARRWEREGNEPHGVVVIRHGHVVARGRVAALAARRHPARLLGEQDLPRHRRGVRRGRGPAGARRAARRRLPRGGRRRRPARRPRSPSRTACGCRPVTTPTPSTRCAASRRRRGVGGRLPRRRARGGARLVVPVPQRRQPGAGAGRAAAHRRSGWSTTCGRACSTRWASREAVWTTLGRHRPRLQRAAHQHRHRRPARASCCSTTACGRGAGCCPPAGSRRRRARWPTPPTTPTRADWKAGYGYQMWRSRARRLPGRRRLRPVRPRAARARPRRRRDVVHRDHPRGARRRLGGAAPPPRRRAAPGRPRGPRPARRRPRHGRRHRHPGRRSPRPPTPGALGLHPRPRRRAPGAAVGRGAPRRAAAGCSRSTTASG